MQVWRNGSVNERAAAEIVLNQEATIAFARIFEMADTLGEAKPEHFVFCACENRNFDDPRSQKWCSPLGTRSPGKPDHEPAVSDERRPFRAVLQ